MPSTGSSAAMPGKGVDEVITTHEPTTATAPVNAISCRVPLPSRATAEAGTSAIRAPTPSSQARVRVEK